MDVSDLVAPQHAELTSAIAAAAAAAWDRNDSWATADLSPVLDLAAQTGADVQIRDQSGQVVASSSGFTAQAAGPPASAPVVARGESQISGSGIGLAVAAELTRAHGGRLSASSQPGQGTRMTLTLPRA